MIDDARTPLIISAAEDGGTVEQQKRNSTAGLPKPLENLSKTKTIGTTAKKRRVDLTPEGMALTRKIAKPDAMAGIGLLEMYDFMERGIQVARDYKHDRDYVIRDGEIVIVDESTGRIAEGRRWSRGIHQAIEANESVEITMDTENSGKNYGTVACWALSARQRHDGHGVDITQRVQERSTTCLSASSLQTSAN